MQLALWRFCGKGNLAVAFAGVGPREAPALPSGALPLLPPCPPLALAVPAVVAEPATALEPPIPEPVPDAANEPPCGAPTLEPGPSPVHAGARSKLRAKRMWGAGLRAYA